MCLSPELSKASGQSHIQYQCPLIDGDALVVVVVVAFDIGLWP